MEHFKKENNDIEKGWVTNSSFRCCKAFTFLEKYQSAFFLTKILQIAHDPHAVRVDVTNDKDAVMVWVIFLEKYSKKAKILIDKIEELYEDSLHENI
jgi:hypothetical protein